MIGQTISHYKILEKLGAGGMGVVYKAQDLKLDRFVALKFLPPRLGTDDDEKKRFIHEAKAASALDHPNICTIYEIDEADDGQMFIAMAYYEGKTLKQQAASGNRQVVEVIDIAMQIVQGLATAHEHGITHRDIKPANVMITKDGVAKIVDFGLAKLSGQTRLTKAGTTVGTIAYMSPEQARGEEVDYHTDIWALGVVLYEMITGQLPFKGEYEQAVVYSILNEEPKTIVELRAGIPVKLQRLVEKAIAKNLHERYQHMSEILADLSALKKELETESTRKSISAEKPAPSIAVLPFVDMSPQRDQEYFCDGISEELLDALTKVGGLRVVSRTSSFAFKGKEQDIRKIGEQLSVGTVLEGSVRKAGNRLRITAQLINVVDGFHLWSEKYDREMKDIFDIQDEISRAIVEALKIKLVGEPTSHLAKRYTENLEAYNLYLKGRYFWNKRFEGGLQQAMEHFKLAIEKEPTYTLAHVGLADCFIILGWFAYLAPKEAFPKAKAAVQKALEIDDRLAEAHASLGFIKFAYDWDWLEAEQEFKRSIELNPNYATVHWWYAFSLIMQGRIEESLAEIKRAHELDPLSLIINTGVGLILYFARQYDQALEQCLKTLELDPNFGAARTYLGRALTQKSKYEEAIAEGQKALKLLGPSFIASWLGHTYAISGKKDEARKLLNEMNELSKQRYVSLYQMAPIHLGLGEIDQAFELLEKAYEQRDCYLCGLKADPLFDGLRSDSHFIELLKKMGLNK